MIPRTPPKRLAVIAALQALLEQISVADGDAFDMTGKVYRNRLLFGQDVTGDPPALSIIEAPRSDTAFYAGSDGEARLDAWTLMIQGIVADTKLDDSGDDAYFLVQDVERRLSRIMSEDPVSGRPEFPNDYRLNGMISSVEIAPPIVRPPEAGVSANVFFYLPIRVGIGVKIGE